MNGSIILIHAQSRKLLLSLAQHVAAQRRPEDAKLVHVDSSGLKAAATWHRIQILQHCRECCGGMGETRCVVHWDCFYSFYLSYALLYALSSGHLAHQQMAGLLQASWLPTGSVL